MITAKDVVVVASTAAIYAILALASSAFSIPGFIVFFFPTITFLVFPIWFGLPGVLGIFVGDFIQAGIFKGLGPLGVFNALPSAFFPLIYWLIASPDYSEMRTKKATIEAVLHSIWIAATTIAGVFTFLILIGMMPISVAWGAFWLAMLFSPPWVAPLTIILLRTITPFMKRTGMYYGPYRENRKARRTQKSPI